MRSPFISKAGSVLAIWITVALLPTGVGAEDAQSGNRDHIGLNFIRPDVNRPGNYDFLNSGTWLVSQFKQLGVRWNRLAFSWVLVQPRMEEFDWTPYDRIVEACNREGVEILATLGGHFDRPPVPAWAGVTLADVVERHPEYLESYVRAWVQRYKGRVHYWEILNEPRAFHKGLTVQNYVERILKPSYRIIKSLDPQSKVLPCAFDQLPLLGDKEKFWDAAKEFYDIHNLHLYVDWGLFRTQPSAVQEEKAIREFRTLMEKHGEASKPFWITEIGWWGTASLTGSIYEYYKKDPRNYGTDFYEFREAYTGKEILTHPVVLREDALRAEWMKDLFPRVLAIPGCEKVFLWVSLDEFEGGYQPDKLYGRTFPARPASQVDLWGIIAGDKTWRRSAYVLQELLR